MNSFSGAAFSFLLGSGLQRARDPYHVTISWLTECFIKLVTIIGGDELFKSQIPQLIEWLVCKIFTKKAIISLISNESDSKIFSECSRNIRPPWHNVTVIFKTSLGPVLEMERIQNVKTINSGVTNAPINLLNLTMGKRRLEEIADSQKYSFLRV